MKRIFENDYRIEQNFDVESLEYAKVEWHISNMKHLEKTVRECTLIFYHFLLK